MSAPAGVRTEPPHQVGLAFTAPIAFEPPPRESSAWNDAVQAAVADPLQPDDIENCW